MTPQQANLLRIIHTSIQERGYAPSFQEIADRLGVVSKNTVHRMVHSLREDGLVTFIPGKHRNISITPIADKYLERQA